MMGMRRDGMYRPHTSVYTLYKKYLQHLVIERQRKKTVTVKKQFLRSLGQRGAKLCGVLDSGEPSSAVSWTAGSHALRCLGQCGAKLCTVSKKGVNFSMCGKQQEPNSALSWTAGSQDLWWCLGLRISKFGEVLDSRESSFLVYWLALQGPKFCGDSEWVNSAVYRRITIAKFGDVLDSGKQNSAITVHQPLKSGEKLFCISES